MSDERRPPDSVDASLDEKIDRLRQLLVDAKRFADVHDYFHDELVTDPRFLAAGDPGDNPRLRQMIETALPMYTRHSRE